MGLPARSDSPPTMPSAAPLAAPLSTEAPRTNGSLAPEQSHDANENIVRFEAPSRAMSPMGHALFHNKTRCFV